MTNNNKKTGIRYTQKATVHQVFTLMQNFLSEVVAIDEVVQCLKDHEDLNNLLNQTTLNTLYQLFNGLNSHFTYDGEDEQQQKPVEKSSKKAKKETAKPTTAAVTNEKRSAITTEQELHAFFNRNSKTIAAIIAEKSEESGSVNAATVYKNLAAKLDQQFPPRSLKTFVSWCEGRRQIEVNSSEKGKIKLKIQDKRSTSSPVKNQPAEQNKTTGSPVKKQLAEKKEKVSDSTKSPVTDKKATPKESVHTVGAVFTLVRNVLYDIDDIRDVAAAIDDHENLKKMLSPNKLKSLYNIVIRLDHYFEYENGTKTEANVDNKTLDVVTVFKKVQEFIWDISDVRDIQACVEDHSEFNKMLTPQMLKFIHEFFTELDPLFHYNETKPKRSNKSKNNASNNSNKKNSKTKPNRKTTTTSDNTKSQAN